MKKLTHNTSNSSDSDVIVFKQPLIYGIWLSKHLDWLKHGSGEIVYSDYLGLAKAQLASYLRNGGSYGKVMVIGTDGEPAEVEVQ